MWKVLQHDVNQRLRFDKFVAFVFYVGFCFALVLLGTRLPPPSLLRSYQDSITDLVRARRGSALRVSHGKSGLSMAVLCERAGRPTAKTTAVGFPARAVLWRRVRAGADAHPEGET